MEQSKKDYVQELKDLLDNYEEGWGIFKNAKDWDHPATLKPEAQGKDLPKSWMELAERVFSIIAHGKYGLDTYQNVIEIVDSEQMLDAYTSAGMPVMYDHWSFGKSRMLQEKAYKSGQMGLAYEIVINTNPSIAYCMAQNTKTMQLLVIAHASFGHNSFFKGNHLFRQFTDATEIINDLVYLRDFIRECEERHGVKEVEEILDACHALQTHGVNRYTKPRQRTPQEESARRARIEEMRQKAYDPVLDPTSNFNRAAGRTGDEFESVPDDMEENLLRYIASDAPHLKPWQREIIKRISEQAQYFLPQMQTKLMNEGWASFWHYTLMNDMHDLGLIDDGMMLEFLESHTNVLTQRGFDQRGFSGLNPYALGFAIYSDIKRVAMNPTDEDREWFAGQDFVGSGDWISVLKEAMRNFKDESFVSQYLSPKVMRDFHLFAICDDDNESEIEVTAIHDDEGYRAVRRALSSQYNMAERMPRIEVFNYDYKGDRSLILQHTMSDRRPLDATDMEEVLRHVYRLWGHNVYLYSVDDTGGVESTMSCPGSVPRPKGRVPGPR